MNHEMQLRLEDPKLHMLVQARLFKLKLEPRPQRICLQFVVQHSYAGLK